MNGKIDSSKTNLIYILCERGGNHLITQVKQTIQRLMKFEKYFCQSSPPPGKNPGSALGWRSLNKRQHQVENVKPYLYHFTVSFIGSRLMENIRESYFKSQIF